MLLKRLPLILIPRMLLSWLSSESTRRGGREEEEYEEYMALGVVLLEGLPFRVVNRTFVLLVAANVGLTYYLSLSFKSFFFLSYGDRT